ncbi:UvrD-helicase domain-containing protein [Cellulomonas sp. APG4]|uniref:UvrD-helicase domain-containing protein n=1 Tax=Cellulomonas sp. APG4 TaxID=1538656 RepID=UPI00137A62D2|nr:UvrD-helicase domain-containing protein [Cellulomonas sp. APG4]NCT91019.1 UvrD-helicase domain-containing protein [Cellulomonas sp. APG4]
MTTAPTPPVFDVCGPLPTGTTVLEASAGTGKTFTIAALATRYVAEGLAELGELMLVTFGRAATSELRDRVRGRLVSAERELRAPEAHTSADPVIAHLAACDADELGRRRDRLTRALAQFDAATITTTHGFCQQMLTALGVAADVDADAALVPDVSELRDEVVDDLYLRRYAAEPRPALDVEQAREVARAALDDPQAALEPADAEPDTPAWHRVRFAEAVRAEVELRKRTRRVLDYDDLLTLLRDALTDPVTGAAAAERVRARYRVVMVDEFQDTDPVQWEILRTAFHGHRTLVLIGDPKQAIYAFRGADVVTYLSAHAEATHVATLGRSWRSDAPLLTGLEHVLGQAALGDPRIVVRPVDAQHTGRRLEGGPPLRLRQVMREAFGVKGTKNPPIDAIRELVTQDLAADVVRQLEETRLHVDGVWRPLEPGDVAVLTHRNADAAAVRAALEAAGVPAVESGLSSVFGTDAARHWRRLLVSLTQPGHAGRAVAVALTPFVGWDATRLGTATDAERDHLADTLRSWAQLLAERGVAALLETATAEGLAERLLREESGERTLTDLRHVGQLLHEAATAGSLGTAALTDWLGRRITDAAQDTAEERSRRLETDAAAVQVVTIHASKGLEFPVVYVPFAWSRYVMRNPGTFRVHDDAGRRVLDVGGPTGPDYATWSARALAEAQGEDLRQLYVALTRASSQVVAWWSPSFNSRAGALTRVLLGGHSPGEQPADSVTPGSDDAVGERLASLAAASAGTVVHEQVTARPTPRTWTPPTTARPGLAVGRLDRGLDATWRRTSYSGLTAAAHEHPGVTSEPETSGVQDEPDVGTSAVAPGDHGTAAPAAEALELPMADLPGGTGFGTLVHDVLEHVDTSAPDLDAELLERTRASLRTHLPGVTPEQLAAALAPVLHTPLGPLAGGRTLAQVPPRDRLAELEFELPLAGGDHRDTAARTALTLRGVADLLTHHLPDDDPFAGYAARLAGLGAEEVRGYLTGSIDAVLRVPTPRPAHEGDGADVRYLVVDYKTNRLAPAGEPLTLAHYRAAAMAEAMMSSHYPLQLLLYSAALHRYLRWRQPGYDPERHLGGGLYLFVRGMVGPGTPAVDGTPYGVMAWRPPTGLVTDLSALLDGRPR